MTALAASSPHHGLPVSTHGLVHIYRSEEQDVAALAGVDLDVRRGEMLGLLGPSGAGKSTLLTLFGGLMRPSAGRIRVGTRELGSMDQPELDEYRAVDVGLVLQGAGRNLVPYLSPRDNVQFAQSAAKNIGRRLPSVAEVLDLVGLTGMARARLDALTPGQLQLTALAVGISTLPGLLLADEPTSQLDHHARDLVLDTLRTINHRAGTTIVLVTHDPEVATQLPRTVTIRDAAESAAKDAAAKSMPSCPRTGRSLPDHALDALPPGTLVRVHEEDGRWTLMPERDAEDE